MGPDPFRSATSDDSWYVDEPGWRTYKEAFINLRKAPDPPTLHFHSASTSTATLTTLPTPPSPHDAFPPVPDENRRSSRNASKRMSFLRFSRSSGRVDRVPPQHADPLPPVPPLPPLGRSSMDSISEGLQRNTFGFPHQRVERDYSHSDTSSVSSSPYSQRSPTSPTAPRPFVTSFSSTPSMRPSKPPSVRTFYSSSSIASAFTSGSSARSRDTGRTVGPRYIPTLQEQNASTASFFSSQTSSSTASASRRPRSLGLPSLLSPKRKRLVVTGVDPNDVAAFEGVRRWASSLGTIARITQTRPSLASLPEQKSDEFALRGESAIWIQFKEKEIGKNFAQVCSVHSTRVRIPDVGSVLLSWVEGRRHPT